MVTQSPKPCRRTGCAALVCGGNGYCAKHQTDAQKEWVKPPGKSGRGGRPWRRLREQVLRRDGYLCQCVECWRRPMPLIADEVDHIDNTRDADGRLNDDPDNLMAINRDCHQKKTQAEAARGRRRR